MYGYGVEWRHDYQPGDVLVYTVMGGGETRRVRVTATYEDIKNGRPGFDGDLLDGKDAGSRFGSVWGYDDQVLYVEGK